MNEAEIKTEVELELWLKENCYSTSNYGINGNFIHEGRGLEKNGGLYQWYYTERGERRVLDYFASEREAVQYALQEIKADKHSIRNYLGMYDSDEEVERLLAELTKRGVEYWTDKIPYGGVNNWKTRVFVIGCGIRKARDLMKRK